MQRDMTRCIVVRGGEGGCLTEVKRRRTSFISLSGREKLRLTLRPCGSMVAVIQFGIMCRELQDASKKITRREGAPAPSLVVPLWRRNICSNRGTQAVSGPLSADMLANMFPSNWQNVFQTITDQVR